MYYVVRLVNVCTCSVRYVYVLCTRRILYPLTHAASSFSPVGEYIQLHRDSTVGSITLSPSMEGGILTWQDSALVRAAVEGRTLVVDEADKAPLEVITALKGLVEDGDMYVLSL